MQVSEFDGIAQGPTQRADRIVGGIGRMGELDGRYNGVGELIERKLPKGCCVQQLGPTLEIPLGVFPARSWLAPIDTRNCRR